jgi:uncharacterized membrane protein
MVSDKFRSQLRQEAQQWREDGLIDAEVYQQLSQRYQFEDLERVARDRFVAIVIGLGSLLLGLGIVTLVASNWQAWSRELKSGLLLALFLSVNTAGFYLWSRSPEDGSWSQRLGRGLLLLGTLVLGANMALMAQMFHQSRPLYELWLAWGIGVLAMAYSLRLTMLGVVAIALIGLGYAQGTIQWSPPSEFPWAKSAIEHMPLIASLLFVPLAYWCRSRVIFILGAIVTVVSLGVNVSRFGAYVPPDWKLFFLYTLPPALLWGYRKSAFCWGIRPPEKSQAFQPLARSLALIGFSVAFFNLSFYKFWQTPPNGSFWRMTWMPLIDIVALGAIALLAWIHLGVLAARYRVRPQTDLTDGLIGGFILVEIAVIAWHFNQTPIPAIATFIFNVLLFLLAAGLIREGLAQGTRRTFWSGLVLLSLQILARLFEYETELVLKAFVLLGCGAGVIAAGLWFERYVRTLDPVPESASEPSEPSTELS